MGDLLGTIFQIKVDVKARLSLRITTCVICNVLVYDGPNERLPIILRISNSRKAQRVVGSTFQVYVVIIEDEYQQKIHMTFAPVYRKTSVFNLSQYGYHEISFDNHTQCYGHSFAARLCVYTYHTENSEKMRFTLTDLDFKGMYQGSNFAAGVFVFNQFSETVVKLMKFNRNLPSLEHTNMEIIGTKMHIAIFVYSDFASLSLKFSMFKTKCDMLLVSNNYTTYSGYVTSVDDTPHAFYVSQPSMDLPEYDRCFQLQFFDIKDKVMIIFPNSSQVLMTFKGFKFNRYAHDACKLLVNALASMYYVKNTNGQYLGSQRIVSFIRYMKVFDCLRNSYMQIQIKWLPCKLPCRYLDLEKNCPIGYAPDLMWYDGDNDTCNICEKRYTICDPVLLKNNISTSISIKPNMCLAADLSIRNHIIYKSPAMILVLNENNMISRIPDFAQWVKTSVSSTKCAVEIPEATVRTDPTNAFPKVGATLHAVKAAYWGDVLYQGLSSLRLVSWKEAAQTCQSIRAFLLTIHSLAEYEFIKETFLQSYDTSALYIGLKREVLMVKNLTKPNFKTDVFSGTCYVDFVCCAEETCGIYSISEIQGTSIWSSLADPTQYTAFPYLK